MYYFFDNATIAGLITLVIGAALATSIYRRQKRIDLKYSAETKLAESLLLLEEHCKAVNQSIDRLAGTYIRIKEDKDLEAEKKFPLESLPYEVKIAGEVLMYRIPEDISRSETIASLYFHDDKTIQAAQQEIFSELKLWHDFVLKYITGKSGMPLDLTKRVSEIHQLSLEPLDERIKNLFRNFKKR